MIVCVVWFLSSCENDLADIAKLNPPTEPGIDMAKEVVAYYSDSAVVRAVLKAPTMLIKQNPNNPEREFPKGLSAIFYDESKTASSYLKANYAIRNEKEAKVLMRGDVQIWNVRNERLETEELLWDDKAGKMTTDKFVKIVTPEKTITGYGLIANREFTEWTIRHISGWTQTTELMGSNPLNTTN